MGYHIHHTISVTSFDRALLSEAQAFAVGIGAHVSEIVAGETNGSVSFIVAPDGSKEGWEESDAGDVRREVIKNWLRARAYSDGSTPFKWFEVAHPEDGAPRVIDHQNSQKDDGGPFTILKWTHNGTPIAAPAADAPAEDSFGVLPGSAVFVIGGQSTAEELEEYKRREEEHHELSDLLHGAQPRGIGLCGCGNPEEVYRLVLRVLVHWAVKGRRAQAIPNLRHSPEWDRLWARHQAFVAKHLPGPFHDFVLHMLSNADLLEHGGSVGGSWLTDKGLRAITIMYRNRRYWGNDDL